MKLNGTPITLTQPQPLQSVLLAHQFDPTRVAVELNGKIVPKNAYETTTVTNGDHLEVVSFVGGG